MTVVTDSVIGELEKLSIDLCNNFAVFFLDSMVNAYDKNVLFDISNEHNLSKRLICNLCEKVGDDFILCRSCENHIHLECTRNQENDNVLCNLCIKSKHINKTRSGAKEALHNQAKRMKHISNSSHPMPLVGDTVRIPVPEVDRGRGDPRSILAFVKEITDDGFFRLATKDGIISKCYSRSEFGTCPINILDKNICPEKELSLRVAAKLQSLGHSKGFKKCNCKSKRCVTSKCLCKKKYFMYIKMP